MAVPLDDGLFLQLAVLGPQASQAPVHYPAVKSVDIRSTDSGVFISIGTCMLTPTPRHLIHPHPVLLLIVLPGDGCDICGCEDHGEDGEERQNHGRDDIVEENRGNISVQTVLHDSEAALHIYLFISKLVSEV